VIPGYPGTVHEGPFRAAPTNAGTICPRCPGVMLSRRMLEYVAVDDCPRCGGSFMTARALEAICADLALYAVVRDAYPAAPVRQPPGPMYVRCPECNDLMNRRLFAEGAGVVLDVCRSHGSWFDRGELRAVVAFAEAGGTDVQRKRDDERRQREAQAAARAAMLAATPLERSKGPIAWLLSRLLSKRS